LEKGEVNAKKFNVMVTAYPAKTKVEIQERIHDISKHYSWSKSDF
jgi:hypothetical protein